MQRKKLDQGLSLTDFKSDHLAFKIIPLKTWVNPKSLVPWRDRREYHLSCSLTRSPLFKYF